MNKFKLMCFQYFHVSPNIAFKGSIYSCQNVVCFARFSRPSRPSPSPSQGFVRFARFSRPSRPSTHFLLFHIETLKHLKTTNHPNESATHHPPVATQNTAASTDEQKTQNSDPAPRSRSGLAPLYSSQKHRPLLATQHSPASSNIINTSAASPPHHSASPASPSSPPS